MVISIYILVDPRDRRVRYVGQTRNPAGRVRSHAVLSSEMTPRKRAWIESLKRDELSPRMIIIGEEPDARLALEGEQVAISFYAASGADLLNSPAVGRKPLATEDRPVNAGVRRVPHWTARLDALLAGESRQSLASRIMREGIEREEKRRATVGK